MGSVGIPDPSPPFNPFKECSQEICRVYCPQWCYIILTPPPPLFGFDNNGDSGTYFSPLIVAIIGILASAFILLTYYAIVSKYCRRRGNGDSDIGSGQDFENDRVINDGRRSGSLPGLDEALIKSISVYKYKKDDGLVDGTDCSVCLSEFQEDESLRLLPKCSHAFHLACIDTWLKTNSSCPLCRCNITQTNPPTPETQLPAVSALGYRRSSGASVVLVQDFPDNVNHQAVIVEIVSEETTANHEQDGPLMPGSEQENNGTENREDAARSSEGPVPVELSPQQGNRSVADILSVGDEEEAEAVDSAVGIEIGPSDGEGKERGKSRNRSGVFNLAMKKSISSGIFAFTRYAKGKGSNLPN